MLTELLSTAIDKGPGNSRSMTRRNAYGRGGTISGRCASAATLSVAGVGAPGSRL